MLAFHVLTHFNFNSFFFFVKNAQNAPFIKQNKKQRKLLFFFFLTKNQGIFYFKKKLLFFNFLKEDDIFNIK
jgi:hypothetical protein